MEWVEKNNIEESGRKDSNEGEIKFSEINSSMDDGFDLIRLHFFLNALKTQRNYKSKMKGVSLVNPTT